MHDIFLMLKVLNQDETPLLYSSVFGEGVVNDATSIVLFNAVQSLDVSNIDLLTALKLLGTFLYLFFTSTALGIAVSCFSGFFFFFLLLLFLSFLLFIGHLSSISVVLDTVCKVHSKPENMTVFLT